jgi:hypothetical protein
MAGGLRTGIATYRCSTDGPPIEPSGAGARSNSEGECSLGFAQPVAIAGGRPRRWPDLDRGQRKTRRPRAKGPGGRHGMPNAATTPARNTLR